jgi:cation diffusion facilitator family transporter
MTVVLAAGILIMFIRFAAFFVTNSTAVLTDAFESVINIAAGAFALFSLYVSQKPSDIDHPYGHGKIEFISAGIEGTLILIAGLAIIGRAIWMFFFPQPIEQIDLGILLTAISGGANYLLGYMLIRKGKSSNSIVLIADGKHLVSDAVSSVVLIAGMFVILITGIFWLDNILALLLGGVIFHTGFKLIRSSVAGLMDEADSVIIEDLVKILRKNRRDQWIDVHNLRIVKYGANLHVDCHVTIPWYFNLEQVHREVKDIETLVCDEMGQKVEFFIHADPCVPQACPVCTMKNCTVRQHPFIEQVEWTRENITENKQHFNKPEP